MTDRPPDDDSPVRSRPLRSRVRTSHRRQFRRLLYIIGAVVGATGAAMLVPAAVALVSREWSDAGGIAAAAGVAMAGGLAMWRGVGRPGELTTREGFAAVGLAWVAMSAVGTLPYLFTGAIPSITNAFFETTSGFTTTGASILEDPGALGNGLVLWRSLTQWIGGMGIIVLSIAVLPLLGVGGVELARAESPGPRPDRLTPRFRETAKRLWLVYLGLTVLEMVLLSFGDMSVFQAINHSLTTMSTGGFGTESTSITGFGPYTQWVIILFMFAAGASFALHFRALRDPGVYKRSGEFRLYASIVVAAMVLLVIGLVDGGDVDPAVSGIEQLVRDGLFTALTIVTTTGFATADFGTWVPGLQILVVGLMFVGGMAGSTAGGVKSFRVGVLTRSAASDLRRLVHPRGVFVTRFDGRAVPPDLVRNVQSFFLFYMFLFMTGTFALSVIESRAIDVVGLDLVTSVSAVASALGNIGPGLGLVGPTENFALVQPAGKWLLSGLMLVGRLEIFPILLLLTPDLWRR
nr:TrkH family potassium uptake protein [Salsipaludibacter albus]